MVGKDDPEAEAESAIRSSDNRGSAMPLLDKQYDRMLWNLNHHDAFQRQADRRDLELKAWSRIMRSDVLLAMFAPRWKQ